MQQFVLSGEWIHYSMFSRGFNILTTGSRAIPKRFSYQKGSAVTMELPTNWYEDKGLLGFSLCSLYVQLDAESWKVERLESRLLFFFFDRLESRLFSKSYKNL